ncbi:hypothetical protein GCM10025767_13500 [Thalassotalea piscium]
MKYSIYYLRNTIILIYHFPHANTLQYYAASGEGLNSKNIKNKEIKGSKITNPIKPADRKS